MNLEFLFRNLNRSDVNVGRPRARYDLGRAAPSTEINSVYTLFIFLRKKQEGMDNDGKG